MVKVFLFGDSQNQSNKIQSLFTDPCFEVGRRYEDLWDIILLEKGAAVFIDVSSVSYYGRKSITKLIKKVIEEDSVDIFYLYCWKDRCDLYTNRRTFDGIKGTIVDTYRPSGLKAFILTNRGRSILQGKKTMKNGNFFFHTEKEDLDRQITLEIVKGNLTAQTIVPQAVSFDIFEATSNSEFEQTQTCADPPLNSSSSSSTNQGGSVTDVYIILASVIIASLVIIVVAVNS